MGDSSEPSYRLYWHPGTCARVTYVALEEIGLPYETVLVDRTGSPRASGYLKINPKNKVPTLEIGGRVITENPAIQTFLSRSHPDKGLLPTEGQEGIEALEMVSWFAAGIHRFITPFRFPGFFCDREDAWPSIRAQARAELERAFEILDDRLQGREWLFDSWSLADVHLLWLWFRATGSGMDGTRFANCIAHAARCEARPSVSFVLDREEEASEVLRAAGALPPHTPAFQSGRAPRFAPA